MRVHAIGKSPRYLAYAGMTMKPGASATVPLAAAFTAALWTDVNNGIAQFKLSTDELAMLNKIIAHNDKPLQAVETKPSVPLVLQVAEKAAAKKAAVEARRAARMARGSELSRSQTPATKKDVAVPAAYADVSSTELPELPEFDPYDPSDPSAAGAGPVSLADMKRHNAAIGKIGKQQKSNMTPPASVHVGKSTNGTPGMPDVPAVDKNKALDDAKTMFKGLV